MSEIVRIVAYDKDDNVLFDSVNGQGALAGKKPKLLVEFRTDRTKDGNFKTYGDGTQCIGNGDEIKRSAFKGSGFLGRYRLTALEGPLTIKRITVDKAHGMRTKGIKEGLKLLPGDKPLVFDINFGPLDKKAYVDSWVTIESKEHGVIIKDGIRVVEA